MLKRDYFLACLRNDNWMWKRWVLEAFSIFKPGKTHPYPLGLFRTDENQWAFHDREQDDSHQLIEDADPSGPVFRPLERLELKAGDLINLDRDITTTYGTALVNQFLLVWPFGPKIPYMNGRIDIGAIEKIIQARWDDKSQDGSAIHTAEYLRYLKASGQLPGFSQLCVPSASPKTMTYDPAMVKRRDELLVQYKDQLHDPVVVSAIQQELIAMDKAWMKGDPGERFYIKGKSYDVVRMKLFIMQGFSGGFGLDPTLIPTSLSEGWKVEDIPAMINQSRDGSFGRGAQTALGGVEVKNNNRIFQNSTVVPGDCGSVRGLDMVVDKYNAPYLAGNYQVVNGKPVRLDETTIAGLMGKKIQVRSPAYCLTEGVNHCAVCMGDQIASTPQALGTYAAAIGSQMMLVFMSAMHGKSLTTAEMDLDEVFT